jgi:HlyD family secretion protein
MNDDTKPDRGAPAHDFIELEPAPSAAPIVAPAPVLPPLAERHPATRRAVWTRRLALVVLLAGAGGGFLYWQAHRTPALPAWIVYGNGRLEADPIDIATKFAGRVAELRADEGDSVKAGQVLALMDTRDLGQTLQKQQAQAEQAQKGVEEAISTAEQTRSSTVLAQQQMDRAQKLYTSGWTTREVLDQRQQALDSARALQNAAEHRVTEAQKALSATQHDAELTKVNIADNALVAPRDGRIEYRLANVGEVLAAGGKVFTMLDTANVYMDVFLPTLVAGKLEIGSDARILLDAYPGKPIPAKVSFLAEQAQFTPKMVETRDDRDKLMFRVRVRIDPSRTSGRPEAVRSGLPGLAYVKTDPAQAWTPALQGAAE